MSGIMHINRSRQKQIELEEEVRKIKEEMRLDKQERIELKEALEKEKVEKKSLLDRLDKLEKKTGGVK